MPAHKKKGKGKSLASQKNMKELQKNRYRRRYHTGQYDTGQRTEECVTKKEYSLRSRFRGSITETTFRDSVAETTQWGSYLGGGLVSFQIKSELLDVVSRVKQRGCEAEGVDDGAVVKEEELLADTTDADAVTTSDTVFDITQMLREEEGASQNEFLPSQNGVIQPVPASGSNLDHQDSQSLLLPLHNVVTPPVQTSGSNLDHQDSQSLLLPLQNVVIPPVQTSGSNLDHQDSQSRLLPLQPTQTSGSNLNLQDSPHHHPPQKGLTSVSNLDHQDSPNPVIQMGQLNSSKLDHQDEEDLFSKLMASRLRKLGRRDAILARTLINEVLTKAEAGKLNFKSKIA